MRCGWICCSCCNVWWASSSRKGDRAFLTGRKSPGYFYPFLPPPLSFLFLLFPLSFSSFLSLPSCPPPLQYLSFKTKQKSIKDNQIGICYSSVQISGNSKGSCFTGCFICVKGRTQGRAVVVTHSFKKFRLLKN